MDTLASPSLSSHLLEKKSDLIALDRWILRFLLPIASDVNKYSRGRLTLFAGTQEFVGAPTLSALGAFRVGAGYVKLYHFMNEKSASGLIPSEMTRAPFSEFDGTELLKEGAFLFGPAVGSNAPLILPLIEETRGKKRVIDGDLFYSLSSLPEGALEGAILTPHTGELSRLLGMRFESVPHELLARFAQEQGVVILLKGPTSFVYSPTLPPLFLEAPNPLLATAGSGDLLSGVIAGLLSRDHAPLDATLIGLYLHSMAGKSFETAGYFPRASELAEQIFII